MKIFFGGWQSRGTGRWRGGLGALGGLGELG